MGSCPQSTTHNIQGSNGHDRANLPHQEQKRALHIDRHFAEEMGKGMTLGLQTLGTINTPVFTMQGGKTNTDRKQAYGEDDIAGLMEFLGVTSERQL